LRAHHFSLMLKALHGSLCVHGASIIAIFIITSIIDVTCVRNSYVRSITSDDLPFPPPQSRSDDDGDPFSALKLRIADMRD